MEVLHLAWSPQVQSSIVVCLFICSVLFCLLTDDDLVFFFFAFWICVFHWLEELNGVDGGSIASIARWLAGWHDKFHCVPTARKYLEQTLLESILFSFFGWRILVFQRRWSTDLRGAQLLRRSEDISTQEGTRKKARKSTLDVRNSLKVSGNYWNPFLFLPSDRLAAWVLERVPAAPFPLPRPRLGDPLQISSVPRRTFISHSTIFSDHLIGADWICYRITCTKRIRSISKRWSHFRSCSTRNSVEKPERFHFRFVPHPHKASKEKEKKSLFEGSRGESKLQDYAAAIAKLQDHGATRLAKLVADQIMHPSSGVAGSSSRWKRLASRSSCFGIRLGCRLPCSGAWLCGEDGDCDQWAIPIAHHSRSRGRHLGGEVEEQSSHRGSKHSLAWHPSARDSFLRWLCVRFSVSHQPRRDFHLQVRCR